MTTLTTAEPRTGRPGHPPAGGPQPPVFDLHTHPTLKAYMFGRRFWRAHNPPPFFNPLAMRTDLDALLAGGVRAFLCTVYVVERGWPRNVWPMRLLKPFYPRLRRILETEPDAMARFYLDYAEQMVAETRRRRGDMIDIARNYSEIEPITDSGRIAMIHAIEGGHHFAGRIENVDEFRRRGVAMATLAHMYPNELGSNVDCIPHNIPLRWIGCFRERHPTDVGLTDFGREVIDRMWDVGMIVDMIHTTHPARREIYARNRSHPRRRPLVYSHTGAFDVAPYDLNPTAEDIRAVADSGGVIGIIFMTYWLSKPEVWSGEATVVRTIDTLMRHGGEDVVAFGSDFDGYTGPPRDFKSPRDYVRLREVLARRYTPRQVEKFLYGNADRVLREGWGG